MCVDAWLAMRRLAQTGPAHRPAIGEGASQLGMFLGVFRLSLLLVRTLQHLCLREQGGLERGR